MTNGSHYDVIIIGAGAGGGTHWLTNWRHLESASCCWSAAITLSVRRTTGIPKPSMPKASIRRRKSGATEMASRREMLDGLLMRFSWLRIHCASLPNQTDVWCGSSWEAKMKIPAYITGIELLVDGRFAQV